MTCLFFPEKKDPSRSGPLPPQLSPLPALPVCLFPCLFPFLLAVPAQAADIVYDGTDPTLLRPRPDFNNSTKNALYPGSNSFSGNTVTVTGGTVRYVHGGVSANNNPGVTDTGNGTQNVTGNQVIIRDTANVGNVYGGWTNTGDATGNRVSVENGTVTSFLYGGYTTSGEASGNSVTVSGGNLSSLTAGYSANGNSTGNRVHTTGGSFTTLYAGYSTYGIVSANEVTLDGGNSATGNVYAAYSYNNSATNNRVIVNDGNFRNVYGAYSGKGSVSGNTVTVTGGTTYLVTAGQVNDGTGEASDNHVTVSGGTITNGIFGGRSSGGDASGNTITISGENTDIGGYTTSGHSGGSGTVHNNTLTVNSGTVNTVRGGYSARGAARENEVIINGGKVRRAQGGLVASSGAKSDATDNRVTIRHAEVNEVTGGSTYSGHATGNTVIIESGQINTFITGGLTAEGTASGNRVTIGDGTINGPVTGGESRQADATGNAITVSGGTINADLTGSNSQGTTTGNILSVSGGSVTGTLRAGLSAKGDASNNTVALTSGLIAGDIYSGQSAQGEALGNTVTVTAGTVTGSLIAGDAYGHAHDNILAIDGGTFGSDIIAGRSTTADATGNTVIIRGAPDMAAAAIHGGLATSGTSSGNTFQVWSTGHTAKNIGDFQDYEFILPGNVAPNDTVMTLTDTSGTDASNAKVGVVVQAGGAPTLAAGDRVHLLVNDNGVDSSGVTQKSLSGMQGVSLQYDFDLESGDTFLDAVLKDITVNPATGIFNSGRLATLGFLNAGADFIHNQNLACTVNDDGTVDEICLYGAVSGSDIRYDMAGNGAHGKTTGSHWTLGVKGKSRLDETAELAGAAFAEAGWGNLHEHSHYAKGSGDTHYYGVGIIGRYQHHAGSLKGAYAQANARVGRVSTDFDTTLRTAEGTRAGYDKEATYYGAGAAIGYVREFLPGYRLDTRLKYQWLHLDGFHADIVGDPYRFDDIDSHRTVLGTRLNFTTDPRYTPYIGLAWEHEFSANARGTTYGYALEETSLKGDSGIGEIGLSFSPSATSPWTFETALQGYVGQKEGVTGHLQVNYVF